MRTPSTGVSTPQAAVYLSNCQRLLLWLTFSSTNTLSLDRPFGGICPASTAVTLLSSPQPVLLSHPTIQSADLRPVPQGMLPVLLLFSHRTTTRTFIDAMRPRRWPSPLAAKLWISRAQENRLVSWDEESWYGHWGWLQLSGQDILGDCLVSRISMLSDQPSTGSRLRFRWPTNQICYTVVLFWRPTVYAILFLPRCVENMMCRSRHVLDRTHPGTFSFGLLNHENSAHTLKVTQLEHVYSGRWRAGQLSLYSDYVPSCVKTRPVIVIFGSLNDNAVGSKKQYLNPDCTKRSTVLCNRHGHPKTLHVFVVIVIESWTCVNINKYFRSIERIWALGDVKSSVW